MDQSDQYQEFNTINWRDTAHFDSEDDYRTGCRNVSHCQQQSYSGLQHVHPDDNTQPTKEMTLGFNLHITTLCQLRLFPLFCASQQHSFQSDALLQ